MSAHLNVRLDRIEEARRIKDQAEEIAAMRTQDVPGLATEVALLADLLLRVLEDPR